MDLRTTYMGMELDHPIVPSASPLSETVDSIKRLEDAGAPAVVMYSLFEEEISLDSQQFDHFLNYGTDWYPEALDYFPESDHYDVGPDGYLNLIRQAKESTSIPIIGSLNGVSTGGWIDYAKRIEEAGADGLELNVYYVAADPHMPGAAVEDLYLQILREVKSNVRIPVAMKLSPFFSSTANVMARLAEGGADALVLFNRFYQPDLDLEQLTVVPRLVLSNSNEMRLPLRWVAILYGRIPVDFAITSGVHTHTDVLKGMMAGAKITMVASELLRNGMQRIGEMRDEMVRWMEEHEYESVEQMQGSMSQINVGEPGAFERANYIKVLGSWRPDPAGMDPRLGPASARGLSGLRGSGGVF